MEHPTNMIEHSADTAGACLSSLKKVDLTLEGVSYFIPDTGPKGKIANAVIDTLQAPVEIITGNKPAVLVRGRYEINNFLSYFDKKEVIEGSLESLNPPEVTSYSEMIFKSFTDCSNGVADITTVSFDKAKVVEAKTGVFDAQNAAAEAAGAAAEATGAAVEATGAAVEATGAAVEATGAAVEAVFGIAEAAIKAVGVIFG